MGKYFGEKNCCKWVSLGLIEFDLGRESCLVGENCSKWVSLGSVLAVRVASLVGFEDGVVMRIER